MKNYLDLWHSVAGVKKPRPVASMQALGACLLLLGGSWTRADAPQDTPASPASPAAKRPGAAAPTGTAVPNAVEGGYLIGLNFGEGMHRAGITDEFSAKDIIRGINDGLGGKKLEPADQQRLQAFMKSVIDQVVARNRAAAAKFLADNGHKEGVKTTPSGLEYKVITPGDPAGASPALDDQVTVQYRGRLLDGTEFDSSYTRGQPATFALNGVIKGWQEGVALMKPGAKWELFVPPQLAYDEKPQRGIPGGSLLIFDVELVGVKPSASPAAAAPAPAQPPPSDKP